MSKLLDKVKSGIKEGHRIEEQYNRREIKVDPHWMETRRDIFVEDSFWDVFKVIFGIPLALLGFLVFCLTFDKTSFLLVIIIVLFSQNCKKD